MAEIDDLGRAAVSPVQSLTSELPDGEAIIQPLDLAAALSPAAQRPAGGPEQPAALSDPALAGQTQSLPEVIFGKNPSQLIAAEHLRAHGGASATEELLGLNLNPLMLGAFPPPPRNAEALRHLTPSMRRAILKS